MHLPTPQLAADSPLSSGAEDALGRLPFALRIAELIATRTSPEPIAIGIYGRWGDGKSTILNFVEEATQNRDDVVFARFNPWLIGEPHEILKGFLETLAGAVGARTDPMRVSAADAIRTYSGYLAPLLPAMEVLHRASAGLSTRSAEEKKEHVSSILRQSGTRVVVAIDDIDRLERDEVAAVLKLIRLVGDFDQTVYLLAFDPQVVADAVSHRYGSDIQGGRRFLEKIVQLPLVVPPPEAGALDQLALRLLDAVLEANEIRFSPTQTAEFGVRWRDGIGPAIRTPRMAAQLANAAAFALPMLKGEAEPVDVIAMESLRTVFPEAHEFVKDNAEVILGLAQGTAAFDASRIEATQARWDKAIAGLADAQGVRALVTSIFPRFAAELGENRHFGNEWLGTWRSEKRAASPDYLERYFTYHVPSSQMPDLAVAALLTKISDLTHEQLVEELRGRIRAGQADSLLRSLRDRERELAEPTAKALAEALSELGDDFPRPRTLFSFTTAFEQAAILISRLVEQISDKAERSSFAHHIAATAQPIPFAVHIARWMRSDPKVPEDERTLTARAERRIRQELAARIAADAAIGSPLYLRYPDDSPLVLAVWAAYGDRERVRDYVASTLGQVPTNAERLLETYLPVSVSMGTGVAGRGDFERDQYDAVAGIVDPEVVAIALRAAHPDLQVPDSYPHVTDGDEDLRVASQYLYLHANPSASDDSQGGAQDIDDGGEPSLHVHPDHEP